MKVHLKDTAYLNDLELLQIILSSADRFPGLYRFSSTWQENLYDEEYLKLISFLEACHRTLSGQVWNRLKWLSVHQRIFEQGFGNEGRNKTRNDQEIGSFLEKKAIDWFNTPNSFSLAVIDRFQEVRSLSPGQTYYMMGSLIKFSEDKAFLSHDALDGSCYAELKVNFQEVEKYVSDAFTPGSLSQLFFKAEIIGRLKFDEDQNGQLTFEEKSFDRLLSEYNFNSPVFASVNYQQVLPIRFAKLIGVTNVCR